MVIFWSVMFTFISFLLAVMLGALVLPWFNELAGKEMSFDLARTDANNLSCTRACNWHSRGQLSSHVSGVIQPCEGIEGNI